MSLTEVGMHLIMSVSGNIYSFRALRRKYGHVTLTIASS